MCQSSAFIEKEGREELVMEDVDSFEASEGQIKLIDMFGEHKILNAKVKKLCLVDHKIILEPV